MAVRVRDFSRAHPSTDANYAAVLGQMEERIARMEALAKQQQDGTVTAHASTVRRKVLCRRLHHELLRHLVTVADIAFGTLARRLLCRARRRRRYWRSTGISAPSLRNRKGRVQGAQRGGQKCAGY